MSKSPLAIREIIQAAGGPKHLHERSIELAGKGKFRNLQPIAEKTIYAWFENGIPEKHWVFVMPECGVTAVELHRANEALRDQEPSKRVA